MKKILRITPDRCTGCRTCELACAFSHSETFTPSRPRINTHACGEEKFVPVLCLQCDEAKCVAVCPTLALRLNRETGAIEHHEERCIRCRSCVKACPFGNIFWDDTLEVVVKCDLCGGKPICAAFCPTKTLEYV